jgi:hypothetical protein
MCERGVDGRLYLVTEFGYGGLEDIDAVLEKYGSKPNTIMEDYRGFVRQKKQIDEFFETTPEAKEIFGSLEAFRESAQTVQASAVRMTVESLRSNPRFGGYNIVQLFDSNGNEVDGLVDFWRNKRKKSFYAIQQANQPLLLSIRCEHFNPKAGRPVEVTVTLVNEERISGAKTLVVRATGPSGRQLFSHEEKVETGSWVSRLFRRPIPTGDESGQVVLEAELRDGNRVLLKKSHEFRVYSARDCHWPEAGFAVFDPQDNWPDWRKRQEWRIHPYDPAADKPELVVVPSFTALWSQLDQFQAFVDLVDQAKRGSTVLFMGVPRNGEPSGGYRLLASHSAFYPLTVDSVLGFRFDASDTRGGWGKLVGPYGWAAGESGAGCPVTRHAVFDGLPGPGLMDWDYGNLLTNTVAIPLRSPAEDTGPAIQIIPLDSGKVVFCTLRILENLENDGLAERLFSNLTNYLAKGLPAALRQPSPQERESRDFRQGQIRDCWEKFLQQTVRG